MKTTQSTSSGTKGPIDVHQMVTQRIITALEAGTVPWKRTWQGHEPQNFVSGRVYTGINAILAGLTPYEYPYFATLKQINQQGGKVKQGAKSLPIVFWKVMFFDSNNNPIEEEEAKGRDDVVKRFYARYYNVFNIAEVEGIEPKIPDAKEQKLDPLEAGEALVEGMPEPPTIKRSGGEAFYEPPSDTVQVPTLKQFQDAPAFYSVLFHELIHSTGHAKRLARPEVMEATKFGSLVYSLEELTAEIGATFLRNLAGIEHDSTFTNSTGYIQNWLRVLGNDKFFIFQAASKAKAAVNYILG